jgi:hypothetical protein
MVCLIRTVRDIYRPDRLPDLIDFDFTVRIHNKCKCSLALKASLITSNDTVLITMAEPMCMPLARLLSVSFLMTSDN